MIILEFLTMQGVLILQLSWSTVVFISAFMGGEFFQNFLKPQRCCRNTAVAAMVQNSGLFSRSVPSDSSDMGQHLESIPQGSMLGHVAATASSRLGSSSYF